MFLYFYMWFLVSIASVMPIKFENKLRFYCAFLISFFFVIVIGLRYQVGGDWYAYFYMVQDATSLDDAISRTEPAYGFLNFIANKTGFGMVFVNIMCAVIFTYGLMRFCFAQPFSWLALSISVPYLLIVVAMGYSRQSVAIGFVMLAYLAFGEQKMIKFAMLIMLASFFHKTAIVFLLFLIINKNFVRSRYRVFLSFLLAVPIFYLVVLSVFQSQLEQYVAGKMNSDGGFIRSFMNFVPAILLIFFSGRFYAKWGGECFLYKKIAFLSIVGIFLVGIAPTAVDRFSLYFIPLQIFVFSRIPLVFTGNWRVIWLVCINIFYGFFLWYWLSNSFYAQHFWLPYKSYLF